MEPTGAGIETKALGSVVQIEEGKIQAHLDEVVRNTVEEALTALLDAEAVMRGSEVRSGRRAQGYTGVQL
jgi:hypothetical protein